jgi:PAS domain S-box-containing protein
MAGDERLTIGVATEPPPSSGDDDFGDPPESKPAALVGEARDIADLVLGAVPSGILVCNSEGEIVLVNPAAAKIFGSITSAMAGRHLTSIRGELEAMLWPTHKGEVLLLDSVAPGGRGARVLGFTSRSLMRDGIPAGTVIVFSDITEQKSEARADAHRRRLADIGQLVATMAHEIRNPLAAISTLSRLLQEEEAVVADDDAQLIVSKILDETRRIARLVDDILGFSRDRELQLDQVDVVELLETLVEDVKMRLGDEAVPLEVQVKDSAQNDARHWRLDREGGRSIFSNLVRNAVQAVQARGDRADHHCVVIRVERILSTLRVAVMDDGIGIAPEDLPRITEPFFTTRPSGTGLGMAVTQRLVAQHGGRIEISSVEGEGTTVAVLLPA